MLPLSLGLALAVISFAGFLINAYIILVVIVSKQISANSILLLHLGIVNSLLSILFLIFSLPNIVRNDGTVEYDPTFCTLQGILLTSMHPIAIWTICCLNCDRYYAIAAPLHYGTIVNTKKIIIGLIGGWLMAFILCIPPFFQIAPYRYNSNLGACVPYFGWGSSSIWYAIVFTVITLSIPGVLIIVCNVRVLLIARYHRHRIASAIYEVTLSAQVTITHQRNPFYVPLANGPKLRSRSAISTVLQLICSFLIIYCPYYIMIIWNSSVAALHNGSVPKRLEPNCSLVIVVVSLLCSSTFINGLLYGVKSKIMRKTFQNYWRKKRTKSEICQEIQARTPSACESRRPSLSTLAVFNRPTLQRRLSDSFVDRNKPIMKRISSDISWRPSSLTSVDLNESPTTISPPSAATVAETTTSNYSGINNNNKAIQQHTLSETLQIPLLYKNKTNDRLIMIKNDKTITFTPDITNDQNHIVNVKNKLPNKITFVPDKYKTNNEIITATIPTSSINNNNHRNSRTATIVPSLLYHSKSSLESAKSTTSLLHKVLRVDHKNETLNNKESLPKILITETYSNDGQSTTSTLTPILKQISSPIMNKNDQNPHQNDSTNDLKEDNKTDLVNKSFIIVSDSEIRWTSLSSTSSTTSSSSTSPITTNTTDSVTGIGKCSSIRNCNSDDDIDEDNKNITETTINKSIKKTEKNKEKNEILNCSKIAHQFTSLEEADTDYYSTSSDGTIAEQLMILSWPTTRKKYKLLQMYNKQKQQHHKDLQITNHHLNNSHQNYYLYPLRRDHRPGIAYKSLSSDTNQDKSMSQIHEKSKLNPLYTDRCEEPDVAL